MTSNFFDRLKHLVQDNIHGIYSFFVIFDYIYLQLYTILLEKPYLKGTSLTVDFIFTFQFFSIILVFPIQFFKQFILYIQTPTPSFLLSQTSHYFKIYFKSSNHYYGHIIIYR